MRACQRAIENGSDERDHDQARSTSPGGALSRNEWEGEGLPPPRVEKPRGGMLPYSFSKISRWYYNTSGNCRRVFQKSEEWCTQALALALLVPDAGGDVIIDGDTTSTACGSGSTRRRYSSRAARTNWTARRRQALFRENIMEDSVMKPVIAIAMSMAVLAPSVG